jgi:hypothetical protein
MPIAPIFEIHAGTSRHADAIQVKIKPKTAISAKLSFSWRNALHIDLRKADNFLQLLLTFRIISATIWTVTVLLDGLVHKSCAHDGTNRTFRLISKRSARLRIELIPDIFATE